MTFRTVCMDPPWPEKGGGKIKRGADKHYPLMKVADIRKLLVDECAPLRDVAEHAHMWMWATDNYLPDGLWLMSELGFTFKRTFPWVKVKGKPKRLDFETGLAVELEDDADPEVRMSLGQYGRGAHELLLFGVRGKGQDPSVFQPDRSIPSVFFAPVPTGERGVRIHSRKPDASYELIERRSKGPYLELFARRQWSPEWTCWGNEAPT